MCQGRHGCAAPCTCSLLFAAASRRIVEDARAGTLMCTCASSFICLVVAMCKLCACPISFICLVAQAGSDAGAELPVCHAATSLRSGQRPLAQPLQDTKDQADAAWDAWQGRFTLQQAQPGQQQQLQDPCTLLATAAVSRAKAGKRRPHMSKGNHRMLLTSVQLPMSL